MVGYLLMALMVVGLWYVRHKNISQDKEYIKNVIKSVDAQMRNDIKVSNINSIGKDSDNNDVVVFDSGHSLHLSASQILFVEYEKNEDVSYHMLNVEEVYNLIKRNKSAFSESYVIEKVTPSVTLKVLRSRYDELKR
ncbi:TPA: hypothetical protein ACGF6K_002884 [Staphylococcus aureus]|uniref:hypothetical protein n=1 Tax=Staphylococcus aureus TaxID=1280 RepID=UPI00044E3DBC|nr:hypothetical protein [Staphylococcus aureus]EUW16882.1 hypothetical protein O402_02723 [Staphylococcus aureus M0256]MBD6879913.1 hypothetical protein [Staphylococcus aureus]MCS5286958.1 hypothetical protein [Staphylococcus aureus]MCT2551786.1 hypothetical protein [Staphylococcus aureus]MCT2566993.1 hypothetical protein [Staphylococcus aureus]